MTGLMLSDNSGYDPDELHTRQHKHEFNVQFSVISKDRNFLNALEDINSNELGDQIKQLIKNEDRQFTTE